MSESKPNSQSSQKKLCARHILLSSKHQAEDILSHIKDQKLTFQQLAQKYSQCPSASMQGDLGNLWGKKNVDEDFMLALEKLNIGEISGIIRTRFGYHIIQRYE